MWFRGGWQRTLLRVLFCNVMSVISIVISTHAELRNPFHLFTDPLQFFRLVACLVFRTMHWSAISHASWSHDMSKQELGPMPIAHVGLQNTLRPVQFLRRKSNAIVLLRPYTAGEFLPNALRFVFILWSVLPVFYALFSWRSDWCFVYSVYVSIQKRCLAALVLCAMTTSICSISHPNHPERLRIECFGLLSRSVTD